jgi:G:T-mismatch repair DNA endonuclease (very short patch repair protein)
MSRHFIPSCIAFTNSTCYTLSLFATLIGQHKQQATHVKDTGWGYQVVLWCACHKNYIEKFVLLNNLKSHDVSLYVNGCFNSEEAFLKLK